MRVVSPILSPNPPGGLPGSIFGSWWLLLDPYGFTDS